jgi:hypothetical protein
VPERLRDALGMTAAALLGVTAFLIYCGWWVLIPTNIAWLDYGDRAMHQLGWMFFREAPWGIPPGASPLLGIEISSSIALVDGLPLFAIPFKLIEQWLPEPFQYWGYWLLLSFVLQSVLAWRIAREFEASRLVALVAAGFVLIAPAYLFRVPIHLALSAHWTILAALFLYVRREPPRLWMWPLLISVTSAIHATLLAMVLALWAASLLQRLWTMRTRLAGLIIEVGASVIAALTVLWVVGFFGTTSYGSYGYGVYKLNLLWPILTYGWSQLFPDLPHTRLDYEGLSFPGIGILALLALATATGAIARLRHAVSPHWLPLTLMLGALMVFALSKDISVLNVDLLRIPVPAFVEAIGSAFRSTGRFVWPLLYVVTIGAVVLVGRRLHSAIALPLVALAFASQAVDSFPRAREFAQNIQGPAATWPTEYRSPVWQRVAAAGYARLRSIPPQSGYSRDWKHAGYFAVTNDMDTDIALLARADKLALSKLRARSKRVLLRGNFEPRTLYVLDLPSALAAAAHAGPDDLLVNVDGRFIFARGAQELAQGLDLISVRPAD